jgi:hypothetical protein
MGIRCHLLEILGTLYLGMVLKYHQRPIGAH